MILVRQIFRAKFGKAGELAAIMRETNRMGHLMKNTAGWRALTGRGWRVLTDLSGSFDTVILELEVESLAEWERLQREIYSDPVFLDMFARSAHLIQSGHRELLRIEAQG